MREELRDALEVPGHVVMIKTISKHELLVEGKKIIDEYEKKGLTKLRNIPQNEKDRLIEIFDALGLPHDDLR